MDELKKDIADIKEAVCGGLLTGSGLKGRLLRLEVGAGVFIAVLVWISFSGIDAYIDAKAKESIRDIIKEELAPLKESMDANRCLCDWKERN